MRVSRAVSLALLTVGLTVGGISAAAADASAGGGRSTDTVTNQAAGPGSNSTTADGVARYRANEGVTAADQAYGDASHQSDKAYGDASHQSDKAYGDASHQSDKAKGGMHDCTCSSGHDDRYGKHHGKHYGKHHRRYDEDMFPDLLEGLF